MRAARLSRGEATYASARSRSCCSSWMTDPIVRALWALLTMAAAARASSTRSTVNGTLISTTAPNGSMRSRLSRWVIRSLPSILCLVLRACPDAASDVHQFFDGEQVASVHGRQLHGDGRHVHLLRLITGRGEVVPAA